MESANRKAGCPTVRCPQSYPQRYPPRNTQGYPPRSGPSSRSGSTTQHAIGGFGLGGSGGTRPTNDVPDWISTRSDNPPCLDRSHPVVRFTRCSTDVGKNRGVASRPTKRDSSRLAKNIGGLSTPWTCEGCRCPNHAGPMAGPNETETHKSRLNGTSPGIKGSYRTHSNWRTEPCSTF